jgi:hypothetical protein
LEHRPFFNLSFPGNHTMSTLNAISTLLNLSTGGLFPSFKTDSSPTHQNNDAAATFANYAQSENNAQGQYPSRSWELTRIPDKLPEALRALESFSHQTDPSQTQRSRNARDAMSPISSNTPTGGQNLSFKTDPSPSIASAGSTTQIRPRPGSIDGMDLVENIAKKWEKAGVNPEHVRIARNVEGWPDASPSDSDIIMKVAEELQRTGDFDTLQKQVIRVARNTEIWPLILKTEATKQAGKYPPRIADRFIEPEEVVKLFGWKETQPDTDKATLLYMMVIAQANTAEAQEERTAKISNLIVQKKMKEEAKAAFKTLRPIARNEGFVMQKMSPIQDKLGSEQPR